MRLLDNMLIAALITSVAGCTNGSLAPMLAQPKTPPARNITSFGPALQCMDGLLQDAGRPRILITATQIPDQTYTVSVGTTDMLINAISQMNRNSGTYVFINQAIVKRSSGDIITVEFDDVSAAVKPAVPRYYISGSISQVDADISNNSAWIGRDDKDDLGLHDVNASGGQSVVTLDLHLAEFPSRLVIPGAAVSNSMVVTERSFGGGLSGEILDDVFGISVDMSRMESMSQAVRNLIELSLIELLGSHAGVPYWECLALPDVNARQNARQETEHVAEGKISHIREAQNHLIALGRLAGEPTGLLDSETRLALAQFQSEYNLLASGEPDFDTLRALKNATAELQNNAPAIVDGGEYKSLASFLD